MGMLGPEKYRIGGFRGIEEDFMIERENGDERLRPGSKDRKVSDNPERVNPDREAPHKGGKVERYEKWENEYRRQE